jgi:DNA replicative helicase MCM subunit Mcm2 (Cdc46/Mcm family)
LYFICSVKSRSNGNWIRGSKHKSYEPTSRYTGGSRVEQLENLLLFGSVEECVQKIDALREAAIRQEDKARQNHKNIVTSTDYEIGGQEEEAEDDFFDYIIGYNDAKKFLRMSINTEEPVHILLIGPPASAKTMFIKSMMMKLNNSYFTDGGNTTKAGMLEYIFENKPKYLLIDEIDNLCLLHYQMENHLILSYTFSRSLTKYIKLSSTYNPRDKTVGLQHTLSVKIESLPKSRRRILKV